MNKKNLAVMAMILLGATSWVHAKEKTPNIQANTSSLGDSALIDNIAVAATGMGAKEPLSISDTQSNGKRAVQVMGSNGTVCRVPISEGSEPQMMGISCK